MYNCEILNMYDADRSGMIETPEYQRAIADELAGTITDEEAASVGRAWLNDVDVGAVCPVTAKDAMIVFKTFAVAAVLAYVVTKIIWR